MKKFFRRVLKRLLGVLSRKTIAKHNAEIIVITGWTGTSIVKELVYHLLSENFNVRRNINNIWWDFSVPLTILGYEDKKRNILEWIHLVLRAFFSLNFKPKYTHKIIISLDTSSEDTAKFWSEYVTPHIVVVLKERPESKVVKMMSDREGSEKILFVYNPKFFRGFRKRRHREFIYSNNVGELRYKKSKGYLVMKYKEEKVNVKVSSSCKFISEFIPAAISVGILESLSLKFLASNLAYFDFHPQQLRKVFSKLKHFIHSNGK